MTLFAWINADDVVVNITVCENELLTQQGIDISSEMQEQLYTQIINQENIYAKITSKVGNIRKQYAGIGYTYDPVNDVFICPQPYPSWTLDNNFDWQPPTPMPVEEGKRYAWFEPNQQWIELV